MPKLNLKLCLLFLLVIFGGSFISFGQQAFAYFSDAVKFEGDTFTTATLGFELQKESWDKKIGAGEGLSKEITIKNESRERAMDLMYDAEVEIIEESNDFCSRLSLNSESLQEFSLSFSKLEVGKADVLEFTVGREEKPLLETQGVCEFKIVFSAWQTNLEKGIGFTDKDSVSSVLKSCPDESPQEENNPNSNPSSQAVPSALGFTSVGSLPERIDENIGNGANSEGDGPDDEDAQSGNDRGDGSASDDNGDNNSGNDNVSSSDFDICSDGQNTNSSSDSDPDFGQQSGSALNSDEGNDANQSDGSSSDQTGGPAGGSNQNGDFEQIGNGQSGENDPQGQANGNDGENGRANGEESDTGDNGLEGGEIDDD